MYERHERVRGKIQNGRPMWFILYTFSQSKVISFFCALSLLTAVVVAAAVHVENENRIQGKYMRLRANLLPHVWAADWMRKNIWGKKNFFMKKECNFLCRKKNISLLFVMDMNREIYLLIDSLLLIEEKLIEWENFW